MSEKLSMHFRYRVLPVVEDGAARALHEARLMAGGRALVSVVARDREAARLAAMTQAREAFAELEEKS